jgi:hypothetical protein
MDKPAPLSDHHGPETSLIECLEPGDRRRIVEIEKFAGSGKGYVA